MAVQRKRIDELNLTDQFLFDRAMENAGSCSGRENEQVLE